MFKVQDLLEVAGGKATPTGCAVIRHATGNHFIDKHKSRSSHLLFHKPAQSTAMLAQVQPHN